MNGDVGLAQPIMAEGVDKGTYRLRHGHSTRTEKSDQVPGTAGMIY